MKNSDKLFQLIASLTANEKRYFKLYAGLQDGEKNYLQLFDAIEQQDNYNEPKLLQQFAGAAFTRHFSYTKNYLYSQLLRSLTHSQSDNFVEQTLWDELHQAKLLHRKQLYRQCARLLEKTKKKAYWHEAFSVLPELLLLQGQLISKFTIGQFKTDYMLVVAEREKCMKLYENYLDYKNLYDKLFFYVSISGSLRKTEVYSDLKALIDAPIMQSPEQALSKKAKILYYNIWFLYAYYTADYETSLHNKKRVLQLIESTPTYFTEDLDIYVSNISNIMVLLNLLHRYEQTLVYMQKLKTLKADTLALQAVIFQTYYNTSLVVYAALANLSTPLSLVPDIEKGLSKHKNSINKIRRIDLCFNVSILYFKAAQYAKAHEWLEKVFNEGSNIREDIQCFARIFNLLIHFELGNYLLMESLVRNYIRYLKQHKKMFRFEKVMLQFFNKAIIIVGQADLPALYKVLLGKLHILAQNPQEQQPLSYFDFVSWVESKLENEPLQHVLQRKVKAATNNSNPII